MDIHAPNTEVDKTPFDPVTERDALRRLANDQTVEVFVGCTENTAGTVLIQYWRGKFWHPTYKRQGFPREYLCQREFYHRDRVAELLRKDRDT